MSVGLAHSGAPRSEIPAAKSRDGSSTVRRSAPTVRSRRTILDRRTLFRPVANSGTRLGVAEVPRPYSELVSTSTSPVIVTASGGEDRVEAEGHAVPLSG